MFSLEGKAMFHGCTAKLFKMIRKNLDTDRNENYREPMAFGGCEQCDTHQIFHHNTLPGLGFC